MAFQIHALTHPVPTENAVRMIVDKSPGFPCRITLEDAAIGEEVLLVHYEHHAVDTPFRSSHAIFIRTGKQPAHPAVNEVPVMLKQRILSLRAFDPVGMLLSADLAEGELIAPVLERMFEDQNIDYIHLHFAKPGCYAARAERVAVE